MAKKLFVVCLLTFLCSIGMAPEARATILDLTAGPTSTPAFINGGLFVWTNLNQSATGTGVINSFVRMQANTTEQGYNTDGRPVEFDENTSATFTHSLLLSSVPIVTLSGVKYREFLLDINQNSNNPFLSVNRIQLFLNSSPTVHGVGGLASLGTPLFNLDVGADGDSSIWLDASDNAGSGKGDMFAYIPDSLFTGNNQYLYLYSHFGTDATQTGTEFTSNGGFEEWAICQQLGGCLEIIPEPSSFGLLGIGLLGLWKRRKKARP